MTRNELIYIDASATAVLSHGATDVNCLTLLEAKLVFDRLAPDRQEIATITSRGKTYTADQINRFHYAKTV